MKRGRQNEHLLPLDRHYYKRRTFHNTTTMLTGFFLTNSRKQIVLSLVHIREGKGIEVWGVISVMGACVCV